ncbi:MAG: LacI family DNA-binding transcriptional regulator, partial [Spirochaetia bacterium]|nr:LacI family DNA-binding transcriptional regulator [Spirochaetia bacterium]
MKFNPGRAVGEGGRKIKRESRKTVAWKISENGGLIAVINAFNTWENVIANDYWVKIISGILEIAAAEEVNVRFFDSKGLASLADEAWQDYAGLIGAVPREKPERMEVWRKLRTRLPCVDVMSRSFEKKECYVGPNEGSAMALIFDHLYEEGHRSFFFASLNHEPFGRERREVVIAKALERKCNLQVCQYHSFYAGYGALAPERAAEALLGRHHKERPQAILFESDFFASRFLRLASKSGIRVPEDLGVAGINDTPEYPIPVPLTTLRHDGLGIGREAARLLFGLIRGEKIKSPVLVESALIIRRSSLRRTLSGDPDAFRAFVKAQVREHCAFP